MKEMDIIDYLLAKKKGSGSQVTVEALSVTENGTYSEAGKAYSPVTVEVPLPTNANERQSVTSYPVTDSANYPLPKCDVTVTDADKCEVIVTTDNTINEDSGVYLERQSGGGNRELDVIVGGSVVWNQLVGVNNIRGSQTTDYVTFTKNNDGTFTLNGTASRSDWYVCAPYPNEGKTINGHVYYAFNANKNGAIDTFGIGTSGFGEAGGNITIYGNIGKVIRANGNNGALTYVYKEGVTIDNETLKPIIIDLTAVFGTTIADYIYSLEQATAGSGIAWLRSYGYLTEDYYGYTANKIESVSVARHVMKDSNDSVIGSYPINPITLRGIPKLNASNQLYYDGDRYEASGRVTRKYGIVDLGTLSWTKSSGIVFTAPLSGLKYQTNDTLPLNAIGGMYTQVSKQYFQTLGVNVNLIMRSDNSDARIYVNNSDYNDAAAFKTAMSGVYLVYEKNTPTYEDSSPYETNQIVDANGTEEYIDAGVEAGTRDVAIPVGHETKYYNGKAYVKPLTAGTSDTVSMADMGIMPTSPMYISANGSVDVEYWKSNQ